MKIKNYFSKVLVLAFAVLVYACGSSDDGSASASSITITADALSVFEGQSITFTVKNNLSEDVTSNSQLSIAGNVISNPHTFNTVGDFDVTAISNGLTNSVSVSIEEMPEPESLTISTSSASFWYDGGSAPFVILDHLGNDVTSLCTATAGSSEEIFSPARFSEPGVYNLVATYTAEDNVIITSNSIALQAIESTHTTKVMVEDYTGGWCQFCPRLAYALQETVKANENVVPVAIHQGDPMEFPNINSLLSTFEVSGFPAGRVNRTVVWNESAEQPVALLANRQNMGLAINSSLSGTTIAAEVKVHYDLKVDEENRIVVYLLENGLVYPQVNYYNADPSSPFYNLGNPIAEFVHDHTARTTFTDVFGDVIPAGDTGTNSTYTVNYSLAVPGNVENIENLELVAFVVGPDDKVLNVQKADLGENKDFD